MTYFLGLTGGIATGKTTADAFFEKKNIPIIDADRVAHDLMQKNGASYTAIVDHFGASILNDEKEIDRKKLGKIVFGAPAKLNELNQITHPLIRKAIVLQMQNYQKKDTPLAILDVPLLFETHYDQLCDSVLVISADLSHQLARLQERNNLNKAQAMSRINSQMKLQEKEKLADFVVDNNGSIADLEAKLSQILVRIGR
ncbi:dephospho-CoA kinase [Lactobacillus hominis]|uniref:Dephospho-CoA kinase n=1 Tax=Lactobacillus hominis DSM 23910 = CRBIP 24.179 TaxID=1423758 RepID=I7L9Y3_9LACO|nr:dephospho-CoA kinase [Lactobacillus hominis]KRM85699.1 dephospho-CoA kinase [Lactobacillus hominis DSM 23910 = CRBIP 24.179]MCT3347252.1 dephospho-CoA kinase [Lactobacillus hominis]CCI81779.1 Dephospho-CoA kinase [Lactobacillus hominis DSM 23910 = CRBIP 24.179]